MARAASFTERTQAVGRSVTTRLYRSLKLRNPFKRKEPCIAGFLANSLLVKDQLSKSVEISNLVDVQMSATTSRMSDTTSLPDSIVSEKEETSDSGDEVSASSSSPISASDDYLVVTDNDDDGPTLRGGTCSHTATGSGDCGKGAPFATLRLTYLLVTLVIMLADGMQGTHLYVLYEGYGYSVASLYCLGFLTGGVLSPITGPLVDKIGRKKAAMLYCALEMFINGLEQYPMLWGLILSRMIGGFTTNLLSSVFETWLDTEYRRRGLEKEKYEIIMRDSVIVSNMAAIFSGYLAHVLAEMYGPVGPFRGAVTCTALALMVVSAVWTENYGHSQSPDKSSSSSSGGQEESGNNDNLLSYLMEAYGAFKADSKMLRVAIIQGLSVGSIQIFIFLWSPALRQLSVNGSNTLWGLDSKGEPAYGLIFGAFMAAGVLGGVLAPIIRKRVSGVLSPTAAGEQGVATVDLDGEKMRVRPMAVECLAALCYFLSALLLLVPCFYPSDDQTAFSTCLVAFLVLELLVGIVQPCEGVIRSLYFPTSARASIMSLPRLIVNGAVSLGVVSTNFVSLRMAFGAVASLMLVSTILQLSLLSRREWTSLLSGVTSCRKIVSKALAAASRFVVTSTNGSGSHGYRTDFDVDVKAKVE